MVCFLLTVQPSAAPVVHGLQRSLPSLGDEDKDLYTSLPEAEVACPCFSRYLLVLGLWDTGLLSKNNCFILFSKVTDVISFQRKNCTATDCWLASQSGVCALISPSSLT